MEKERIWRSYVGDLSPLEFMQRMGADSVQAAATSYVASLPRVFGIVRAETWKASFRHEEQARADAVVAGIVSYLDDTEDQWLNDWEAWRRSIPAAAPVEPSPPPEIANDAPADLGEGPLAQN